MANGDAIPEHLYEALFFVQWQSSYNPDLTSRYESQLIEKVDFYN